MDVGDLFVSMAGFGVPIADPEAVKNCIETIFGSKEFTAEELQSEIGKEIGYVPDLRYMVAIIIAYNEQLSINRRISSSPLVVEEQERYIDELENMRNCILTTEVLLRSAPKDWWDTAILEIRAFDGSTFLSMPDQAFFIGYLHDGEELIVSTEQALQALTKSTSKRRKVRELARRLWNPLDQYIGAMGEISVLGPFATAEKLIEFEPKVGKGKAEALIEILDSEVVLEVTSIQGIVRNLQVTGSFDPERGADRVARKILEKSNKLCGSEQTVVLFLATGAPGLIETEIPRGVLKALITLQGSIISAIITSRHSSFSRMRLEFNPYAKFPLQLDLK